MAPPGFTDLSNELMARVIDFTPANSLSSLACVSSRFPSLVVPRLYRSIFYDPIYQISQQFSTSSTRIYNLGALVNTLEENEHLRGLVGEAKLIWGRLLEEMHANWGAITRLINLLPKLEILQLLPGHVYLTCALVAPITSLHICIPQSETVTLQALEPLLRSTTLRKLSVTTIKSWAQIRVIAEEKDSPPDLTSESLVSHLTLSSTICPTIVMQAILRAPKALQSLHYHYNGGASPDHSAIMPSTFPFPLLSYRASLEELVIHAQPHQHIPNQHPVGDVMRTLRQFSKLKRLGLPAWWMVHPKLGYRESEASSASHATKLVQILPPDLEVLQVQLEEVRLNCRNQLPFEHLSIRREDAIENYKSLLRWLQEIAEWKQSHIPALREVIVWSSGLKLPHEQNLVKESRIEETFFEQGVGIRFIVHPATSSDLFGVKIGF